MATGRSHPLVTVGLVIAAIVSLYVGAGIFVPLVLAVLLAFALGPLVNWLRRMKVPHILAAILTVILAAAVVIAIGYIVATQLVSLAAQLPSYQSTVANKLRGVQTSLGGANFLERLGSAVEQIRAQLGPTPSPMSSANSRPVPVTIANTPDNPLGMVQSILGSVLGPMATAAIVVVFLVFLLLERADLRDRFLKLVSRGDLRTSTKVMNEAATRVGRYLLAQFSVNLVYGLVFGAGLTVIGVPNGILWGLLATLFRYIPYVGTLLIATIPFTLAFAIDPGWSMLLKSVALYVTLELVTTNAIEPRLYGSSTGLSPLAVLVAAMFWATLWGPIGLILATPLTVCLVVVGRYVPQLQFLNILFGSEPVLQPEERLYQRLVAGNVEEAMELAEEFIEDHDPGPFYEQVLIPALRLAERDLSADPADMLQRRQVIDSLELLVDELEQDAKAPDDGPAVVVIGAKTELDAATGRILGSLLVRAGAAARVLPPIAIRREALSQLDVRDAAAISLVYLGERVRSHARLVIRRLRQMHPDLRILVVLLNEGPAPPPDLAGALNADAVATSVDAAVRQLFDWRSEGEAGPEAAETMPAESEHRLAQLQSRIRTDPRIGEFLQGVADEMGVEVAIATIAGIESAASGKTLQTAPAERASDSQNLAAHVLEAGTILVIPDASKAEEFAEDPFLLENGVHFFAGVPLSDPDTGVTGVLSIMDANPRQLGPEERARLLAFAEAFEQLLKAAATPAYQAASALS